MDILANPIEFTTSDNGAVPAGALAIYFKNIGNQTTIVNGVELEIGEAKNYGFVGKAYQSIPYQTNGSTLRINYTI